MDAARALSARSLAIGLRQDSQAHGASLVFRASYASSIESDNSKPQRFRDSVQTSFPDFQERRRTITAQLWSSWSVFHLLLSTFSGTRRDLAPQRFGFLMRLALPPSSVEAQSSVISHRERAAAYCASRAGGIG
jgi:hypothetical protein